MKINEIPDPKNKFINNLHNLIQLGRLDKIFSISAINAIGLMSYRNICFNNLNFSGIDL